MKRFFDISDFLRRNFYDVADILRRDYGFRAVFQHFQPIKGVEKAGSGHNHAFIIHNENRRGGGERVRRTFYVKRAGRIGDTLHLAKIGVKAAGGIRDAETAKAMIAGGCAMITELISG